MLFRSCCHTSDLSSLWYEAPHTTRYRQFMAGIKTFSFPIRIYFEDTDSGGVVYHSNYLKFMERARTEWLRSVGIDQRHLKQQDHIMFVVHRIDIQYKLPARLNDDLIVKSELIEIGSSKIEFRQMIYRNEIGRAHV